MYLALRIESNEVLEGGDAAASMSETHSTNSYTSTMQMACNYKSLALKKHIFAADCFLDMEKLPRKTQQILSKFEMIVIAKVIAVTEQTGNADEADGRESFDIDEIDLSAKQVSEPEEVKMTMGSGSVDQEK